MRQSQGFSLVEILVVILIIGISLGFALVAFGDFGESRRLLFAAEQLANTLELAQQEAILESSTLGLRIDDKGYQLLVLQNSKTWSTKTGSIFKMHYFPKNTVMTSNLRRTTRAPAILISSSGDMTPFILQLGTNKEPSLLSLRGKSNGSLSLSSEQKK